MNEVQEKKSEKSISKDVISKNTKVKDIKIKGLRPTLRIKKRFIYLKIHSKQNSFDFKTLSYHINAHILNIIGAYYYGVYGIWILKEKCNEKNQLLVIKMNSKVCELLQAVLSLPITINNEQVRVEILNISGTLKQLICKYKNPK